MVGQGEWRKLWRTRIGVALESMDFTGAAEVRWEFDLAFAVLYRSDTLAV